MDLSYEETMRRIEEYEKNDFTNYKYCKEKKYPWHIHIYKGENQIIVSPLITSIGWYSVEMAWYRQITDVQNPQLIGEVILEAFEHIRISPVDARTQKERDEDSFIKSVVSYKTYKSFNRNYLLCGVILYEDGHITISQTKRLNNNNGYGGDDNTLIILHKNSDEKSIGNAVIKSFSDMEAFYQNLKKTKKSAQFAKFETLSGMTIAFQAPQSDEYTDEQDYSAAEIYQGYSYSKASINEPIANLYFGIAPELDCDISSENICRVYKVQYGNDIQITFEEVTHSLFELRVEITGEQIHHIIYLKKINDHELLSCELILNIKLSNKKLHTKIVKDFENMVKSCKIK